MLLAAIRWLAGEDMWGRSPKSSKVNDGNVEIPSPSVVQRRLFSFIYLFIFSTGTKPK